MEKNLPAGAGDIRNLGQSLDWKDPLEEGMATTPVFLTRESHGPLRSLEGYSPWGLEESDITEVT